VRILFVADVFGTSWDAIHQTLRPTFPEEPPADVLIVNG
jgi:hypothetical protein